MAHGAWHISQIDDPHPAKGLVARAASGVV